MTKLVCRNKVEDFYTWKDVFDAHRDDHEAAGLFLDDLWQNLEDPNDAFFVFDVEDIDRAQEFLDAPENREVGEEAGVIDGEYWFVDEPDD